MSLRPERRSTSPASAAPAKDQRGGVRAQLLEAAGHVFAERGFDRATGKEICELAGTNTAAVNYYFGGIEGLYAEVLAEARRRVFAAGPPAAGTAGDPKARLGAFIQGMVAAVTSPASASWVMRVLTREIISPTPALEAQKEMLPRAGLLRGLVSELSGLPEDHPAVARCCLSIMAPLCMLLICDRRSLKRAIPALNLSAEGSPALAEHLLQYAIAGIAAIAKDSRRQS